MTTKIAIVEWISNEEGGRAKPPMGIGHPPYATVVHFVDEPWPHEHGSWSLVIEKNESQSTEFKWIASVHFLVEDAPHDSLREGRAFELYEGKKRVAHGRIIGE